MIRPVNFLGLLDPQLSKTELHTMSGIIYDNVFNVERGFTWLADILNRHSKDPLSFVRRFQSNIQDTWRVVRDCTQMLMTIFLHHNLPLVMMLVMVIMPLVQFSRLKFFRSVEFNLVFYFLL